MNTRRVVLIFLLFILSWILFLDRAAISSTKDAMATDLGLSNEAMGMVFGAFALGYAIAQVPSGWFADWMGPRLVLAFVVTLWSLLTALTGAMNSLWPLIIVRFVFGLAEAGAYPAAARVYFSWFPSDLHGRANGIVFSGSRLGAAFAFPILAWLIGQFGWRWSFYILCVPGLIWAVIWAWWFRNTPADYAPPAPDTSTPEIPFHTIFTSRSMLLAMVQYFAGNFTFFLCLSWMNPYLIEHYKLSRDQAAWYLTIILLIGATAQWAAGFMVDRLHRSHLRAWSRRIPGMGGFVLSALGLILLPSAKDAPMAVAFFTLATFGAELTISPSWAFCIDIGGRKSGAVSGSMNMIGNFGSFVSASSFPWLYRWTGSAAAYFLVAAGLNVIAIACWGFMRSDRRIR